MHYQQEKYDARLKQIIQQYIRLWNMHRFIGKVGDDTEPAVNFLRYKEIIDKKILCFTSEEEIEQITITDLEKIKAWLISTQHRER